MQYLRRLVWYIASRLLVITLVLGLMVTGFYYAMNVTNINVVLKDGMARRAQVIMMTEDSSELTKYFRKALFSATRRCRTPLRGTPRIRTTTSAAWITGWKCRSSGYGRGTRWRA